MVKSYLKFEQSQVLGQICSASANIVWDATIRPGEASTKYQAGRAIVPANERVLVWDLKKGEIVSRWTDTYNTAQVTCIVRSDTDIDIFAVGYEDGKIRLWDSQTATVILTFNGHKSAVTQLRFDSAGVRLASGGRDTDIILWDLIAEVGLFRLRGHKDQITSLNFLSSTPNESQGFLISTSKDALIKLWDLATQHAIETHVAQSNGECWSLGLSPDGDGCITGGNEGELRLWSIDTSTLADRTVDDRRVMRDRGSFYRQGKDRTVSINFHPTKDLIAIHGSEKAVELWRIRSDDEVKKTMNRKRRRKRERDGDTDVDDSGATLAEAPSITDIFVPYVIVRTGGKVRGFDWAGGKSGLTTSILVSTTNNQLEVFDVARTTKKPGGDDRPDYNRVVSIDIPGHRSDIRCLALSSDDRMLASASHGSLKIWNTRTQSCLRSLECGHAICAVFLPGDKIVVIGTREGTLELFDIASSVLLDTIEAHEKDVWSLAVNPDGKSLVSGSADKSAKFWDLKVVQEELLGTSRTVPRLTLAHTRSLKTADDILAVCFSPNGRLLAVSTLDSTVKVFFLDTLKLFLTLYGHKLPVLKIDISYDSKLIVTSSADKNVRVWGLDFGDCHKAFFAHNDSILSVAFIPNNNDGNGHNFFSASKDKTIKYFDADKFEQIQKLEGHQGEIWTMCVAHSGEFLVSASHDKSIRIWRQTDEQIFLEEEREKELEELYEKTLVASLDQEEDAADHEVGAPGKQTVQTLMAGEKIAEALELGIDDLKLMQDYESAKAQNPKIAYPQRNPYFLANNNVSASQYVYNVVHRIPAASLQDALLVLSFTQLPALFTFLAIWASEGRNIALTCRILFFMVKTHQKQIVSSKFMKIRLEEVRGMLRGTLRRQERELGFNLAGLRVTRRLLDESRESDYGDEVTWQEKQTTHRGKKRTFVSVA